MSSLFLFVFGNDCVIRYTGAYNIQVMLLMHSDEERASLGDFELRNFIIILLFCRILGFVLSLLL